MDEKNNSDSSDTLRTTKTMREKAEVVRRCFLAWLKCWRICKNTKKTRQDSK